MQDLYHQQYHCSNYHNLHCHDYCQAYDLQLMIMVDVILSHIIVITNHEYYDYSYYD